jgi:AraC-like DNA-binding protein
VATQSDAVPLLRELHDSIMMESVNFDKEENFYFLIEQLLREYTQPVPEDRVPSDNEIQLACGYMEKHYTQNITLDDISRVSGLSKYTLLRNFTVQKGITPYQYLSTIRINHAKKLLEAGTPPLEAAMQSGFSDQSHFTRFFKTFIGLTPKLYQNLFASEPQLAGEPQAKDGLGI